MYWGRFLRIRSHYSKARLKSQPRGDRTEALGPAWLDEIIAAVQRYRAGSGVSPGTFSRASAHYTDGVRIRVKAFTLAPHVSRIPVMWEALYYVECTKIP